MNPRHLQLLACGALALLPLAPKSSQAATLATCDEASLRAAIAAGGPVTFACDATITLTSPIIVESDAALDAAGHAVTISGGGTVRVFEVRSAVAFALIGLRIADGLATTGAGILNAGGNVTLTDCTLTTNSARNTTAANLQPASGGAIHNENGVLRLVRTRFTGNEARGWNGLNTGNDSAKATAAFGGAVVNRGGSVTAEGCVFSGNVAQGGDGGVLGGFFAEPGMTAYGGALYSSNGTVNLSETVVIDNAARGGNGVEIASSGQGGVGASAFGGGIASQFADMKWSQLTVASNVASGGTGGRVNPGGEAAGGGGWNSGGSVSIQASLLQQNEAVAGWSPGGPAGNGSGGGFYNDGGCRIVQTVFATNTARGGRASGYAGGAGTGQGGGLFNRVEPMVVQDCLFQANRAVGGAGALQEGWNYAAGGSGVGGGLRTLGGVRPVQVANSAFLYNRAQGGPGSSESSIFSVAGPAGNGGGGGAYFGGSFSNVNLTISSNTAAGGPGGTNTMFEVIAPPGEGSGGGIYSQNTGWAVNVTLATNIVTGGTISGGNLKVGGGFFTLLNTILANRASWGNCAGIVIDGGNNLCSDESIPFVDPTSLSSIDPQLAPLAYNGSPRPTHALRPGSPAIDAGNDNRCPPTDQRGVTRPRLLHCDIGSYEFIGGDYYILSIIRLAPVRTLLHGMGLPGHTIHVLSSRELGAAGDDIGSTVVSADGLFDFENRTDDPRRFYQVLAPE